MSRVGRPLAMSPEDRREVVFRVAEGLFVKSGYDSVTMADIARHAAMSKKTLYTMFATKDDLLRELVSSSFVMQQDSLLIEQADPVEELRLRLRMIAQHVLSDRHVNLMRLAVAESIRQEGLADEYLGDGIGKNRAALTSSIEKIGKDRTRVALPPSVMMNLLFGATTSSQLVPALLRGQPTDISEAFRVIDLVLSELFLPARSV